MQQDYRGLDPCANLEDTRVGLRAMTNHDMLPPRCSPPYGSPAKLRHLSSFRASPRLKSTARDGESEKYGICRLMHIGGLPQLPKVIRGQPFLDDALTGPLQPIE